MGRRTLGETRDVRLDAVVLAGGGSRRMGRDKPLLRVDGERLVDRVVRIVGAVADRVVVAAGTRPLRVAEATVVPDPGEGPLAGIVAGLAAVDAPHVAVVAVDQPDPCPGLLLTLAQRRGGAVGAAPVVGGRLQPLHAVWGRAALPDLRAVLRAGERSPTRVLEDLGAVRVGPSVWGQHDPTGTFAVGWNRPADLDARAGGGPPRRGTPRVSPRRRGGGPPAPAP